MEQKLTGRTLSHVVFMLRSLDRTVQQRAAMSLAKLAPEPSIKSIFVDKRGLDVLLDMLVDAVRLGSQHMSVCIIIIIIIINVTLRASP
jgi:hypothetical protein